MGPFDHLMTLNKTIIKQNQTWNDNNIINTDLIIFDYTIKLNHMYIYMTNKQFYVDYFKY